MGDKRSDDMDESYGRRQLQRGAKDKAYAERIAAGQEVCKRPSGATTTSSNRTKSTKPQRRQNKKRPRQPIEKVATPQNWPFPEHSFGNALKKKKSNGPEVEKKGSRRGRSQRSRRSNYGAIEAEVPGVEQKSVGKAEFETNVEPNDAPCFMKMQSTRSTDHSTEMQTDVHGKHSKQEIAASAATDFNGSWTCRRCTLLNGNRRKKCEVCGSPRGLSIDEDRTLSINDMIKDDCAEGGASSGVGDVQSCQAAEIGRDERKRQSQMSDIFDAPVGTRSRR